ncbi:MAG: helix-turn-helix domain-containing protein [Acidimicrobiales bacterium]
MRYRERAAPVVGTVLWERTGDGAAQGTPIMPDGCMDLLWDGKRLFIAGPDTAVRWHWCPPGTNFAALRFAGGVGPALLGVPAHELRDQSLDLEELWSARQARVLTERVEPDPSAVLEAWVVERAARCDLDPFGLRVWSMAASAVPVATMAAHLAMSTRQLHRRCLAAFGYGPRHLVRVIRFGRALEAIRTGAALAQVAAACGYADQAHLTREVRALTGTTPRGLLRSPYTEGSAANRSTGLPSGSKTTA